MDERALFDLSERQHNLVARRQARRLGFNADALDHRIRRGDWTLATDRVLRRVGAAVDAEEPVMTAVLHAGEDALAATEAAAWLWQVPGIPPGATDVIRDRASRNGKNPHRPRLLLPHHCTEVRGVPVTSLPVTIFHLAALPTMAPARLARIVATIVGRSPAILPVLDQTLDELAVRGRPGITTMRAILAEQDRSGLASTGLERRFDHILRQAGEAPMDAQVDLGGHSWIGRIDRVDRSLGLLAEIDSVTFHSSHADQLRDAARDEQLRAAGYRKVIRIPEEWIWYQPAKVVAAVRDARRALRTEAA